MTPFNISKKQLKLNRWVPSYKKRKFYKNLRKTICYECRKYGYSGYDVDWDKLQEGDKTKKRCLQCKNCLAKNCCKNCGYDYTYSGEFKITAYECGHCDYLDKWGPVGDEYLALRDYYEEYDIYKEDDRRDIFRSMSFGAW